MPEMLILSGLPGSGKTTHAKKMYPDYWYCSADDFFMKDGKYQFDPTKIGQAHSWCLNAVLNGLDSGKNIVVDNTNCTAVEIAPYYALGLAYGYNVRILQFEVNPYEAVVNNIHGVPAITIGIMFNNLQNRKLQPWWIVETVSR